MQIRPPQKAPHAITVEPKLIENVHRYLYNNKEEEIYLNPNTLPTVKENIKMRFIQTITKPRDKVYSIYNIMRVVCLKKRTFPHNVIVHTEYTIER